MSNLNPKGAPRALVSIDAAPRKTKAVANTIPVPRYKVINQPTIKPPGMLLPAPNHSPMPGTTRAGRRESPTVSFHCCRARGLYPRTICPFGQQTTRWMLFRTDAGVTGLLHGVARLHIGFEKTCRSELIPLPTVFRPVDRAGAKVRQASGYGWRNWPGAGWLVLPGGGSAEHLARLVVSRGVEASPGVTITSSVST